MCCKVVTNLSHTVVDLGLDIGGVDSVNGGGGRNSLKVSTVEIKVIFSMFLLKKA